MTAIGGKLKVENKIRYFVRIKPEHIKEFKNTTIEKGFFAGFSIIEGTNQCVFKIFPSESTIIIPYDYILWMAPSKLDFDRQQNL